MKSQKGGPGPVLEIKDARPMCVTPFEAPLHTRPLPRPTPHSLSVHLNGILSHTRNWQDHSIMCRKWVPIKKGEGPYGSETVPLSSPLYQSPKRLLQQPGEQNVKYGFNCGLFLQHCSCKECCCHKKNPLQLFQR